MSTSPTRKRQSSATVPTVPATLAALDQLAADTLVLFLPEDVRPLQGAAGFLDWRLCGALSQSLQDGTFRGAPGEVMLMPTHGRLGQRRVFVFGVGAAAQADLEGSCRRAGEVLNRARVTEVVLVAPDDGTKRLEQRFLQGFESFSEPLAACARSVLIDPDASPKSPNVP